MISVGQPNRQPSQQPWRRLTAWLLDWLCISLWVAALAGVGSALYFSGAVDDVSTGVANMVSFLVLIVPVTVFLAWLESGVRGATIGKRVRQLRVVDESTGSRVPFRRALLRNSVKIALPWGAAHIVVYALFGTGDGSVPVWLFVATLATYILPVTYLVTLFVGRGRTPYDVISRTIVVSLSGHDS